MQEKPLNIWIYPRNSDIRRINFGEENKNGKCYLMAIKGV